MADDVPDYMSDSFLKELEAAEKSSKSEEKKRLDKLKRKRAEAETKPRCASSDIITISIILLYFSIYFPM